MSRLLCFESLDSTNRYLKDAAAKGAAEGTVVLADTQLAGRGRQGRQFVSLPGRGVYMSMLLRPETGADVAASLTAASAVAVCRAIEKACGVSPEIKWINDLELDGRKICGILCESSVGAKGLEYVVVGIGLNVSTLIEEFPPELRDTAGSVYSQTGIMPERGQLVAAIVAEMDAMYAAWRDDQSAYLTEYRRRCKMLGHCVEVYTAEGPEVCVAEEISGDFGLVVRCDSGERKTLHSGEVSVRRTR